MRTNEMDVENTIRCRATRASALWMTKYKYLSHHNLKYDENSMSRSKAQHNIIILPLEYCEASVGSICIQLLARIHIHGEIFMGEIIHMATLYTKTPNKIFLFQPLSSRTLVNDCGYSGNQPS